MGASGADRVRGVHWRHGYGEAGEARTMETAAREAQRLGAVRVASRFAPLLAPPSEDPTCFHRSENQTLCREASGSQPNMLPVAPGVCSESADRYQFLPLAEPEMLRFRHQFARQSQSSCNLSRSLCQQEPLRTNASCATLAREGAHIVQAQAVRPSAISNIHWGLSKSCGSQDYVSEANGSFTTQTPMTQLEAFRYLGSSTLDLAPGAQRSTTQWQTDQAASLARCAAEPTQPRIVGQPVGRVTNVTFGQHVTDHSTSSQTIGWPTRQSKAVAQAAQLHGEPPIGAHQWRPWIPHPHVH